MTHERRLAFGSGGNPDTSNLVFFSVNNLSHNQTLDGGVITQVEAIACNGLQQTQALNEAVMSLIEGLPNGGDLFPDDLSHVQTLSGGVFTQDDGLACDDIEQTQPLDIAPYEAEFLDAANIEQTQAMTTPGLFHGILGMDGPSQVQSLDTAGLDFIQEFSPTNLTQTQPLAEDAFLIAVANKTNVIQSTSSTSITIGVPNGKLNGDVLITFIGTGSDGENHTASTAWTSIFEDQGSGGHTYSAFSRVASSEPSSYTFSWVNSVKSVGTMLLIKGESISQPTTAIVLGGNDKNPISASVTPFNINALFLAALSHDQAGGRFINVTHSTQMFEEVDIQAGPQNGVGIQIDSEIISSASGTRSFSLSKKEQWLTASIVVEGLTFVNLDALTQTQTMSESQFEVEGFLNLEDSTSDRILLEDGFLLVTE